MEAFANAILEEMRPSIQQVSQETEAQLLNSRIEKFQLQHDITEAELEAMNKLTEKVLPAPKVSLEDHLDTLLGMVRAKTPKTPASSKTKIAENFQRKPASTGIEGNEERVKETTKPSIKSGQEAVEEALRKLQAEES